MVFLTGKVALLFSNAVGLLLSREEDRQVVRSAAENCGLEPLELTEFKGGLPLIVTDDERAIAPGADFGKDDSPLIIEVRDDARPDDPEQNAQPAWVLHRPLRVAAVSAQLRQAAYANRIFATRHHSILEELHRSRKIFDSVGNGIMIADARAPDLPLVYVNAAFERMTGYSAGEVYGRNCRFLQGSDTDQPALMEVRRAISEKCEAHVLLKNYRKDATPFWNELNLSPILDLEGSLTYFVGIQSDVTRQVETAQRLDYLSTHDYLTGLANRGLLLEQLKHALLRARRKGENVAVLFFDLDNFKQVNDLLGHEAGDLLLQVVADRLRAETRGGEVVARLGGDEFVVVLEGFSDERRPYGVMHRLTTKVGEAVKLFEQQIHPKTSVGMALFPQDGDTPEALLRVADFSLYAAKHSARQGIQINQELAKPT
jgi:diguanylate cyclase (GGDEF)-like protein/PAS domain S-box-containing protein